MHDARQGAPRRRSRRGHLAGSTARSWLYQACTPTPKPEPTASAEPDAASLASSPIFVHGPARLAGLPDERNMPCSTLSLPASNLLGDSTIAYSLEPSAE